MSWNINVTKNSVKVSGDFNVINEKLWALAPDFYGETLVNENGKLEFLEDWMEHMDWLSWNAKVLDYLSSLDASGTISFSSNEGDNAGDRWGIRFNGDGTWDTIAPNSAETYVPDESKL